MNVCIVLLALSATVVTAEYCDKDSDCTLTACGTGLRVDCYKHHDDAQVCTCVDDGSHGGDRACGASSGVDAQAECGRLFAGHDCHSGDNRWHCFDGVCRCGFFG